MAIRIEYLLLIVSVVLLLSILGINPISQEAKSAKGEKEVEFQHFSLYDIKKDKASQEISAEHMVKYQNYLEMREIDLKDEKGHRLLSEKAIYEEQYIFMHKGVKLLSNDGLKFSTNSLNYNINTKDIKTDEPFILEFNATTIKGENLLLNMDKNQVSADNIEASIYFVPILSNTTPE